MSVVRLILLFITLLPTTFCKTTYQFTFPQSDNFPHAIFLGTIDHPLTDYTLCHWTKINAEFVWGAIFSYRTTKLERALTSWLGGDGRYGHNENNETSLVFGSEVNTRYWLHTCLVSSAVRGTLNLYFNGIDVKSGVTVTKKPIPPNGIITLGQHYKNDEFEVNKSFYGSIADLFLWDYILSPQQVAEVYACKFTEEANVVNWNLHTWQPLRGVHVRSVKLPCGH